MISTRASDRINSCPSKRTLLQRILGEQFVRRPLHDLLRPLPSRRSPFLRRIEAEFIVFDLVLLRGLLSRQLVLMFEPQDGFEREALADKMQDRLDVLDREDAGEDLAFVSG